MPHSPSDLAESAPAANHVLVVDDDAALRSLLQEYLGEADMRVTAVADGAAMLQVFDAEAVDLVVLDLRLPGEDGMLLARRLRERASVPIVVLTGKAEEADRVMGLELAADDYVTKPFSPKELVARVKAQLRRGRRGAGEVPTLAYRSLVVDAARHVVTDAGREVHLTAKEFLLLQYLIQHQGRVLTRDLLLTDVWGYQYTGGTRTVDVHVRRLREKLPLLVDALVTVKQFGYKLAEAGAPPGGCGG